MNQRTLVIGAVIVLVLLALAGFLLYDWVLGETEAASGPIVATPVAIQESEAASEIPVPTATIQPTQPILPPTEAQAAPTQPVEPTAAPAEPALTVYSISQADSEVRFIIYEELRGQPVNVVGRSDQVAGQIALDPADLSSAAIGPIQVNARTLETDSGQRNSAIRNRILNTDTYEFITFTPNQVTGLSGSAAPGTPVQFQVAGDLTIRDVTQPVVFEVTAQIDAEGRISGTATTTVQRGAFNLVVPNVPGVANVGEDVTLEIDFVAVSGG